MQNSPNTAKRDGPLRAISACLYGVNVTPLLDHWSKTYKYNCTHRGRREAIKYMKALYTMGTMYALYQEPTYIPFRSSDRNGIPKDLKPFKALLRSSVPETRAALAVLRQFELFYENPSYDLTTVTEPCKPTPAILMQKFQRFLSREFVMPSIKMRAPYDHMTSKKGPSGKPAISSWDSDLWNLPSETLAAAMLLMESLGDITIRSRLIRLRSRLFEKSLPVKPTTKIQVFPERGGKTRIIAIYDYWTQRALKPLHDAIFRNLRKIIADPTFSQEDAAEWLCHLPKGTPVYSYDLTAATDRIPMWIHRMVLERYLVNNQRALIPLIEELLLRKFQLSWNLAKSVSYNCGQPMGAYGSWALLAYSHHAIALYCGASQEDYRIIGDDIVIKGKQVGIRYKKFMNSIGVEISQGKSMISGETSPFVVGEVAKRLIRNGKEITPPTPALLHRSMSDWRLLPVLLEDMQKRGVSIELSSLTMLLPQIYSTKWGNNVIAILTFPFGRRSASLIKIKERVGTLSPWGHYDLRELARYFVRYRIALMNRTAGKLIEGINPYAVLRGEASTLPDPPDYADTPESFVRVKMAMNMFRTVNTLDRALELIDDKSVDPIQSVPEILNEEMYYPDFKLQFLEAKYQRQNFFSNTILDMDRRIRAGTLLEFCAKHKIPPVIDNRLARATGAPGPSGPTEFVEPSGPSGPPGPCM